MAFEGLTEKLNKVFKNLRSRGRLTESDVKAAMREIRMALLEADVNFRVVKDFIARVSEKAVGEDILESLSPAQQVIKIVNDELCALMGGGQSRIRMANSPPTVIMFVGLQGAGKTTNIAKLAGYFKKRESRRPLLVACDVYRPPLTSSRSSAASSTFRCLSRARATRSPLRRRHMNMRVGMATTCCLSTRRAVCTLTSSLCRS